METELLPWVLAGVTSIVSGMATAIAVVYRGRIVDLRLTIQHERAENRALIERLFTDHKEAAAAAASTAAVSAALQATPVVPKPKTP